MRRWLAVLMLMSSSHAAAAEPRKTDAAIVAGLGARLQALEASGEFSGAALLARADRVLFRQAYGLASRATGAPNRAITPSPVY